MLMVVVAYITKSHPITPNILVIIYQERVAKTCRAEEVRAISYVRRNRIVATRNMILSQSRFPSFFQDFFQNKILGS